MEWLVCPNDSTTFRKRLGNHDQLHLIQRNWFNMLLEMKPNSIALVAILLICITRLELLEAAKRSMSTEEKLDKYCKRKLNFKTIEKFNSFVDELKRFDGSNSLILFDKVLYHLPKCLEEKESIYALQELIENYDKERPCKYSEVDKLESYAKKYLLTNPKAKTLKFFTMFGVTVGINCRINLLAHLKQADSEVDQLHFIYSIASPSGWNVLINEFTKKSMKFGTSAHQDMHVINRVAKLVPGMTQIDQLDYLDFHHAMNDAESSQHASRESGLYGLKNVKLKQHVITSLYKIIDSCKNLDKFYVNSVLSMAKLKKLGLLVDFLNDLHHRSALLHKWLVATSFCQLMARVKMITSKTDQSEAPVINFEIIHNDLFLMSRRELYSYAAPFTEIHEKAQELVWQAFVNEASWRQKSEAMWLPKKSREPASSVAMKLLIQYIKGVEHDFQEELQH